MSNSLNFLNKPATPAKTIGPQPKPGSTGSTTAPKAAFLDRSNPWAVGGKGAPAQPDYNPLPQNAPAKRAAPRSSTAQRVDVPNRGYNYTDASYTGATPQQRAREIDQAEMNAQVTRQRRDKERQAAAQTQPIKVQARAMAPDLPPVTPPWAGPQVAEQQPPVGLFMPTPTQTRQAAAQQSLLSRAANAWLNFATGAPPQPAYNPLPQNAPAQQRTQPQSPIAAPTQPAQPAAAPGQAAAQTPPIAAGTPPPLPTAASPLPVPAGARAETNASQAAIIKQPAPPDGSSPPPLFYGYAAPGPLVAQDPSGLHYKYRPNYTDWGWRSLPSDVVLTAREAREAREAGRIYRPWASLTDAEKYQLRFGVMPTGPQMIPNTEAVDAINAALDAQHERLGERRIVRRAWPQSIQHGPSGQIARQAAPVAPTATRAAAPGIAAQAAAWQAPATPVTVTTTGNWQPTPGVSQEQLNNTLLEQVNPEGYKAGTVFEEDVNQVAREIIMRYVPGIDPSGMTLAQIGQLMSLNYKPPPGLEQPYTDDVHWMGSMVRVQ